MGTVKKIGAGWAIRYEEPGASRGNRKQKQIGGFKTEKEAIKALQLIEAQKTTGAYKADDRTTTGDLIDIWLEKHVKANLSPKTQAYYLDIVDKIIMPRIGYKRVAKLTVLDVEEMYKDIEEEYSADKAFKCHTAIRSVFYKCYKWGLIDSKLIDRVHAPKKQKATKEYWTQEEIVLYLPRLKDSTIYFNIYIALNLGLRAAETAGLKIEDIDKVNKTINISRVVQKIKDAESTYKVQGSVLSVHGDIIIKQPKNDSSMRVLPLMPDVEKFIDNHINRIRLNKIRYGEEYSKEWDGYLSLDSNGSLITDVDVSSRFKDKMRRTKDIKRITFHDLRHSCASLMLKQGVPLKTIQEILGHSQLSTTADIYSHVDTGMKREALAKIKQPAN